MAYTSLYRKFRPLTFSEMVGQEHITKTLKNQIIADRVGHAYLFNGGRGTGKTTAAKIMARAINCLNPHDGEPCNECEICKSILAGTLTDVVEMDAASNNSVEDIRAIRDEVNFLPTIAKYRVYIIDEVHMLSTGAFNALLKTLEEPPEHVKFILATTEPQKLPATILSRCQRFDFKRISVEDIVKRLDIICKESKIKITNEAIEMIAVLSEGALRDAISILERCAQDETEMIEENQIRELVGIPKLTYIKNLVFAIINKNPEDAIKIMKTIIDEGKDLDNFIWEIIKYVRDILLYKTTNEIQLYSQVEKEDIKKLGSSIEKKELLKLIYALSELANNMKWSTQKSIVFEAGILKACVRFDDEVQETKKNNSVEKTSLNLSEKKKLEGNITNNKSTETETIKEEEQKESEEPKNIAESSSKNVEKDVSISSEKGTNKSVTYWSSVLDKIKQQGKIMIYTNLIGTKALQIDDMTIGIKFPNKVSEFANKVLNEYENKALIEKMISMEAGKTMRVKYINENSESNLKRKNNIEELVGDLDIPINIIDE